ncbi:MAG: hypothetical protein ACOYN4_08950, partial [Bacteroidales bacterium]
NREEKKHLRSGLPHGSCKLIAQKVGVSQQSVSYFFMGNMNSERIERAAVNLYAKVKREEKARLAKLGK